MTSKEIHDEIESLKRRNVLLGRHSRRTKRARMLLAVGACAISLGCRDDMIAPPPLPISLSLTLSTGESVHLKDVREIMMDLPETEPQWEKSDSAFVGAMEKAQHKVFIAFKKPGQSPVGKTARMAQQEAWHPNVMVKKGVRASVDGATLRAGLALVEAKGGTVLSYYSAIGVAYVDIMPASRLN